jgi:hypothetical protein
MMTGGLLATRERLERVAPLPLRLAVSTSYLDSTSSSSHTNLIIDINHKFTSNMSKGQLIRDASHAGSWYSSSKSQLNSQLEGWLSAVDPPVSCIGPKSDGEQQQKLPVPGARMIIAPYVRSIIGRKIQTAKCSHRHAGYSYSGPAAAWAYKAWDVSNA